MQTVVRALRAHAKHYGAFAARKELRDAARVCTVCNVAADALESGNYAVWYYEVAVEIRHVVIYGVLAASAGVPHDAYCTALVLLDRSAETTNAVRPE